MITKERLQVAIRQRKGFTLIEILIVVAIIAILASVVLVGLGPTQQSGRDARRISDLREVQNALELFYNKCGFYPGTAPSGVCATIAGSPGTAWSGTTASLSATLMAAAIGINSPLPDDPSTNRTYAYGYNAANTAYILAAALENANNSAVGSGYNPPSTTGIAGWSEDSVTITPATTCSGVPTNGTGATYCLSSS